MQSRYFSNLTSEYQRSALRQAMRSHPNDSSLQQAMSKLSTPDQVQRATQAGVFINYARSDEILAVELAIDLREFGVSPWLDVCEVSYPDGDWHEQVNSALKTCGLMITILSPFALNDEDVQTEQRHFWELGKLIQPVIYRRASMTHSPFWLPPIDFRHDYQLALIQLQHLIAPKPVYATT